MTQLGRRRALAGAAATLAAPLVARAAPDRTIRIGMLDDMSGPYAEATGQGDVLGARLAIEDFAKVAPDIKVDLVSADMLLKPDVGAAIARGWYDRDGVDVIMGVPQSAVALAVAAIAKEKDRLAVFTGAGLADITGKYCGPNHIQWTYDLWSNANSVVRALLADHAESWFIILADYISGHGMANDVSNALKRLGGRVVGSVAYAFPGTTDFSSPLLQAKASGAQVVCLANAGDDTANCLKQAKEFGLPQSGVKLGCIVMQDYIVHSIGLATAQGLVGAMPFVWNMNAASIAFAKRFAPLYHGAMPNYYHAAAYSATWHYLKAVQAMGVEAAKASGRAACAEMKKVPVDDPLYGHGFVRADGKFIHEMRVWETKTPAQSTGPWDYFRQIGVVPPDEAFQTIAEEGCTAM